MIDPDLVNAVRCAVAVLDGTAGGFSPEEKYRAKIRLMLLLEELLKVL